MSAQQALHERIFDINALNSAVTVLDWDQQTYMPEGGAEARGEHASRLTRMAHEMFVSDETRALLEKATAAAAPG
ncbi:MAG TPA: carboxypeptidase, partial [Armatimonadetes bacterium]|nr:carboxypeptidase [Armatimonadota bacterium]